MIIFTKSDCEYIKSFYFKGEEVDPSKVAGYSNGEIRFSNSSCKYVTSSESDLIDFILNKTSKLGIKSITSVKFVKYSSGDYMSKHRDHMKYGETLIHKTCMIQLSSSDEYSGGDLIVENKIQSREIGNICIINPTELHEVTKITNGERYSAVLFLHDGDIEIPKSLI